MLRDEIAKTILTKIGDSFYQSNYEYAKELSQECADAILALKVESWEYDLTEAKSGDTIMTKTRVTKTLAELEG